MHLCPRINRHANAPAPANNKFDFVNGRLDMIVDQRMIAVLKYPMSKKDSKWLLDRLFEIPNFLHAAK